MPAVETKPGVARAIPQGYPLENGEAMHSQEFLRRFNGLPQIKKAELIEGIVYMGSPVGVQHAQADSLIQCWLGTYASRRPGLQALTNTTLVLDSENTGQPDALLRRLPEQGGTAGLTEEGYLAGPPELVVEVASSSASIDLRDKLRAHCRNGVREYVVWRVQENQVDWFVLEGDEYRAQAPDARGLLRSRIFPGLCLPVEALLAFDAAKVLASIEGQ